MNYLIYSIEDDQDISHIINVVLTKQGFIVKSFYNGKDFYEELKKVKPNLILLDIMLPDISGIQILKDLRSQLIYDDIDIIIISAKNMVIDRIDGLDLGADDYIDKPFDVMELMSRVNVRYRRFHKSKSNLLMAKDLKLDTTKYEVSKNGELIKLTSKEFAILKLLLEKKGEVVSRDEILGGVFESRVADMHINAIRKKIGDYYGTLIVTVHGLGYKVIE